MRASGAISVEAVAMENVTRWKERRGPLARSFDLPMLAVVMTIEIAGIALIALLASRI